MLLRSSDTVLNTSSSSGTERAKMAMSAALSIMVASDLSPLSLHNAVNICVNICIPLVFNSIPISLLPSLVECETFCAKSIIGISAVIV